MKKKLLFVIPNLGAGGAEKSLVNLLNTIDKERFDIDLFLFSQKGLFLGQVPDFVNILPKNKELEDFQKPLSASIKAFLLKGKLLSAFRRIQFFLVNKRIANKAVAEQQSWKYIDNSFEKLSTEYDAAIGFLEKSSIYFVVDKVKAKKKVGFIHNDYNALGLDRNFDKSYFKKLDKIASVSSKCADVLRDIFPEFALKVRNVPNVVSSNLISKLATSVELVLKKTALVSVGRLHPQKGFDLAVKCASVLKQKNIDFHWYILGEGSERPGLEKMIAERGLQNEITLVGLKENPYPYIKEAKIFVQPSRYEGKSIVIDEAKILRKPIIVTNYATAKDQIEDGVNGLICDMNPEALAESIQKYFEDSAFAEKIIANLSAENWDTEKEIDNFYKIINENVDV